MSSSQAPELIATAEFLGGLLLREIDRETLLRMQSPEPRAQLEALGIDVPSEEELDALAAEFFEMLVSPARSNPLVQSLWQAGTYDSEPAVAIRKLAEQAHFDFQSEGARGAPVDHIGSELILWARLVEQWPDLSRPFVREHLLWAIKPLEGLAKSGGFYGSLGRVAGEFINALKDD